MAALFPPKETTVQLCVCTANNHTMTYKLFLDDIRDPSWVYCTADTDQWIVCRSYAAAVEQLTLLGFPMFVSFDHDLGTDSHSGFDFAKLLIEHDLDHNSMPENFGYSVHSANPVGAANIHGLMSSYIKQRNQ